MQRKAISWFLALALLLSAMPVWATIQEEIHLPTVTIQVSGYEVDGLVKDAAVSGDHEEVLVGPEGSFEFYYDNNDFPDSHIDKNSETTVFEKDKAYWLAVMVISPASYDLGDFTAENFEVAGGCEELLIDTYDATNNLLFLLIRLNRFEKPSQTTLCVDGYEVGNQGQDVSVAVESEEGLDLTVGSSIPYALYYPNGDEVGVAVGEDVLNPDTGYWLNVLLTNDTGDFSAFSKYDFTLDIPFAGCYMEKNVEYISLYFKLEALEFQPVERLDLVLDGYVGGACLADVNLSLEQKGFYPYQEYNDRFGFHYDGVDEPGTYITPSDAATLVFDGSEALWLYVNVIPLYETSFTPPPEISLNVGYTECLMKAGDSGSLDIALKLPPLKQPENLEISLSGYEKGGDILSFEANVTGEGAERFPGGYLESYGVFADADGEPGSLLTEGDFQVETPYWGYVSLVTEAGYDLSGLSAEDFTFSGFTPENSVGVFDEESGIYYLYFQLPPIELNPVNEVITFSLEGYRVGEEIAEIQVTHDNEQISVIDTYLNDYVILPEKDGMPDDENFYQSGTFQANEVYWLGICIYPAEGYSLSRVSGEQFVLAGLDYAQVKIDVVGYDEAYVYFKLPAAKAWHDVTFSVDGTAFATQSVEEGAVATAPEEPVLEGKVFLGWFTEEGVAFDFATPITGPVTLIAKFEDEVPPAPTHYDVTFQVNGETVSTQSVEEGAVATAPEEPVLEGKVFLGWFTEEDVAFDFATPITGPVTLIAKFEDEPLPITYGDADGNGKVDAADALKALQHAVKLITLEGEPYTAANVNGDDKIDATDALLMLQYTVKLIEQFPVEQ